MRPQLLALYLSDVRILAHPEGPERARRVNFIGPEGIAANRRVFLARQAVEAPGLDGLQ